MSQPSSQPISDKETKAKIESLQWLAAMVAKYPTRYNFGSCHIPTKLATCGCFFGWLGYRLNTKHKKEFTNINNTASYMGLTTTGLAGDQLISTINYMGLGDICGELAIPAYGYHEAQYVPLIAYKLALQIQLTSHV